jgi:O-acetylhomoserine/O-acetylserine sulfhydrylase-like pyridoxal-dependent enzyme
LVAGHAPHGRRASLTTDIAQTSVFVLPKLDDLRRISTGKEQGYVYTRYANPTIAAAEKKIAALEGGECCVITASGMAAEMITFLTYCRAGDEIVSMANSTASSATSAAAPACCSWNRRPIPPCVAPASSIFATLPAAGMY